MPAVSNLAKQQGATLIFVALWMGLVLAGLLVLDIGNLVWQKRELQKIADLSAMAGASRSAEWCEIDARDVALMNGAQSSDVVSASSMIWIPGAPVQVPALPQNGNACQVKVERVVPYFFIWPTNSNSRGLSASAIAAMKPKLAAVHVRSTLLSLTSERDRTLMNVLIGGLLGGKLDIGLAGWNGLAKVDINLLNYLDSLAPKVNVDVGDYDDLLKAKVQIGDLVEVMLNAVRKNNPTANVEIAALQAILVKARVSKLTVVLGDLLKLGTGSNRDALNLSTNILELLQVFLQVGNGSNALATNIEIPLVKIGLIYQGVNVGVRVVEKPQWKIGNPDREVIEASTAQIRLNLSLDLLTIDVDLGLKVGGAKVRLDDYSCNPNKKSMAIQSISSILSLDLSLHYGGGLSLVPRSTIGPVYINLPGKVSNGLIYIESPGLPPKTLDQTLVEKDWREVEGNYTIIESVGALVKNLIKDLANSSGGLIANLVRFLGWILTPLAEVLEWIISKLLAPILDPLLNEVLKVLGIDLVKYEVAGQINCGGTPELVY